MAQKMQTYEEMSTTKGHPWVPQESQDYVLCSPNVARNQLKEIFKWPAIHYYYSGLTLKTQ